MSALRRYEILFVAAVFLLGAYAGVVAVLLIIDGVILPTTPVGFVMTGLVAHFSLQRVRDLQKSQANGA